MRGLPSCLCSKHGKFIVRSSVLSFFFCAFTSIQKEVYALIAAKDSTSNLEEKRCFSRGMGEGKNAAKQ